PAEARAGGALVGGAGFDEEDEGGVAAVGGELGEALFGFGEGGEAGGDHLVRELAQLEVAGVDGVADGGGDGVAGGVHLAAREVDHRGGEDQRAAGGGVARVARRGLARAGGREGDQERDGEGGAHGRRRA